MYIQYFSYLTFFFYIEPILGCTGSSCGLSLVAESRGYSSCCVRASLTVEHGVKGVCASGAELRSWPLVGTRSGVVARGPICSEAYQGLNLCPLHWPVDSLPLSHQESPSGYCTFTAHLSSDWPCLKDSKGSWPLEAGVRWLWNCYHAGFSVSIQTSNPGGMALTASFKQNK